MTRSRKQQEKPQVWRANTRPLLLIALTGIMGGVGAFPSIAQAELYRWTAPNGDLHYSDNMPSSQAERGYDSINPLTGEVLKHFDRAKTPQEIAAEATAKQARIAAIKAQEDQARKDQALLDLYSSTDDLIRARKQRLVELDALINQAQDALKRTQERTLSTNSSEALAARRDAIQLRKNLAELNERRDEAVGQFARDANRLQQLLANKKRP
ncbi:MAG: DUF4124 domain-containing protein [Halothiobacillus sp.]